MDDVGVVPSSNLPQKELIRREFCKYVRGWKSIYKGLSMVLNES